MQKIFETARMILRELTPEDLSGLMGIFSDPIAMRYYPSTKTEEEVRELVQRHMSNYKVYGFSLWAAILKENNQFAGLAGLIPQDVEGKREVEIGYLFLRKYWGMGLATEGAIACKNYGFNKLGLHKLISLIDPGNKASIRVAERVGMSLQRKIIKWDKPVLVYAVYRSSSA